MRLVEEDTAEMVAVGEDFRLVRQVRSAAVDEVDAGQPVLERDFLRAEVFLDRQRIIGPALTVASLQTIITCRPDTRPMPAIMPAPGTS